MLKKKVTIVGAGAVGSATMIALLNLDLIAEIVLIDQNKRKAYGEALDAFHTTSFTYAPNIRIREGGYEECKDSGIIVVCAGPSAKPGETLDRQALLRTNAEVIREVMTEITTYTKEAIIIVVSNPVDILTYIAQQEFDYPKEKIIGSGTLLDTARFRRIVAEQMLVDTKNVHGYVLGEHGQSAFITWSLCNIAGIPIDECQEKLDCEPIDKEKVSKQMKEVGMDVLMAKGYTNYGVAGSIARIVKGILLNELSIMPVSTTLNGEYGVEEVALSVPCVVGQQGIQRVLEIDLEEEEIQQLKDSAAFLKDIMKQNNIIQ